MTTDFEIIFSCFIVVFFTAIIYIAGKADFLTVVPKIFLDRLEEINKKTDNVKHGIWERIEKDKYCCSCCGRMYGCSVDMNGIANYCQCCGAKMDGKKEG